MGPSGLSSPTATKLHTDKPFVGGQATTTAATSAATPTMWFNRSLLVHLVKCEVLVAALSCVCSVGIAADRTPPTYVMSDQCRGLLDLSLLPLPTLRLLLTKRPEYRPHSKCALALRAPPQQRLVMVVEWLDIAAGGFRGACTDFLSVWEGEVNNRTQYVEGLDVKVCGNEAPVSVTSQGQSVTLYFDSNTVENGAGFSIIFTAFHSGECQEGEFRCDNGHCIDHQLKCDDDDNCGDGSDICLLSLTTAALVVVILTVVCCLIAGAFVLYRYRDRLPGRKKCVDQNEVYQPTTTESTTASTVPDAGAV